MRRILIAEDEPRIASFLEKGLQANGFTTTVTDDGRDALDMADSDDFDLLVLDVGLPGGTASASCGNCGPAVGGCRS